VEISVVTPKQFVNLELMLQKLKTVSVAPWSKLQDVKMVSDNNVAKENIVVKEKIALWLSNLVTSKVQ
jgi:hypothetical protein